MPVIKTLKNGVWTKVSSFGELSTATSSLNGLMSSADKSKLDKTEVRELLWTNPSPANTFAGQTIPLDLSEYDRIELHSVNNANTSIRNYAIIDIGSTFIVNYISIPGNYMEGYSRSVGTTPSGINFGICYKSNGTEDNTKAIPYKIYGIKKVG